MDLHLSVDHLHAIQAHAERAYPEECCGLLLGRLTAEGKILAEIRGMENTWDTNVMDEHWAELPSSKTHRYWVAPEAMLKEMKDARARQLDIIGIYHSHPDHPAVPSECDRQYAWPEYSYIIVSVQHGKAVDTRSWQLDEQQQFQPESFLIDRSMSV